MNTPRTIEEEWKIFAYYISLKDHKAVQYIEMRKAFYAGVATALSQIKVGPPGTIDSILNEITNYYIKEVQIHGKSNDNGSKCTTTDDIS